MDHSTFNINIDMLCIPSELVWLESSDQTNAIILNPELGKFILVNSNELASFVKFVRSREDINDMLKDVIARLIMNRVIYYGKYRPVIDETVPSVPRSVYWETTFGCTLRCVYCYMKAETPKPGEVTTDEAVDLIEQMAALNIERIVFTGGEPLLRKDIWQLADLAKQLDLTTEIITNATLVKNSSVAEKIKACFHHVIVSLDGACPEHNDFHRGRGSFELIVKGIKYLNEAGVAPAINSVVSNLNVDYAEELMNYVEANFNVKSHRFMHMSQLGRGNSSGYNMEDWSDYKKLHNALLNRLDRNHPEILSLSLKTKDNPPAKNCGMGSGEIYIDSEGNVYPCKLVTTPEWYSGNIRDLSLVDILKASPLQRSRDLSVTEIIGCRSCMIRRLCGGGCRGQHMSISGNVLSNNPQFCWTLRHRMIAHMWTAVGEMKVLQDKSAYIPRLVSNGSIWKPEINTALPEDELTLYSTIPEWK